MAFCVLNVKYIYERDFNVDLAAPLCAIKSALCAKASLNAHMGLSVFNANVKNTAAAASQTQDFINFFDWVCQVVKGVDKNLI
jgi:hypothetical protein